MALIYYYDLLSQPSRCLYIFMKMAKIPFQPYAINLPSREHLTKDFKVKFSKFQKVPFIHHGNFKLTESVAIMKYLTNLYPVDDYWYPKDFKKQALVDEYLNWHTMNLRYHCSKLFFLTARQKLIRHSMGTLKDFEEYFLKDNPYITGDVMSFADLQAACEIEQMKTTDFDVEKNYPIISNWLEKVRRNCNPYYKEAHRNIYAFSGIDSVPKL